MHLPHMVVRVIAALDLPHQLRPCHLSMPWDLKVSVSARCGFPRSLDVLGHEALSYFSTATRIILGANLWTV